MFPTGGAAGARNEISVGGNERRRTVGASVAERRPAGGGTSPDVEEGDAPRGPFGDEVGDLAPAGSAAGAGAEPLLGAAGGIPPGPSFISRRPDCTASRIRESRSAVADG